MNLKRFARLLVAGAFISTIALSTRAQNAYGRDTSQPIDQEYTKKIAEYTTEKFFNSPLTDYLPASPNVPTPQSVIGDVAGAPGKLPYAEDVYKYMRMLEKASPRVKVFSIGTTEEGREMIAVAVASESLIAKLDENRARLAKLADPRTINMDDAEADRLVDQSFPIYYITGTIHSTETGAPTALMELAYRLAVDDSPYIKEIRDGMITLITPVVEVDGRDRMVDIYKWHLAHPKDFYPPLVYWGKYVAHDNNRDAMGVTLKLTENVLNTYVQWHPQVLHDLHESVPYLYDNTVGDGPYNAWIDPILADEWQMIGWNNVSEMTKFGMPGVFTHGNFDTWSQADLLRTLQKQGVEISRATASFTVTVPGKKAPPKPTTTNNGGQDGRDGQDRQEPVGLPTEAQSAKVGGPSEGGQDRREGQGKTPAPSTRTFPAGSYIVRMDQPYSRIADSLLDYQYWSPNDPQRTPYDDTGWTFPELFNTQAIRVADIKVLDAPIEKVPGPVRAKAAV